LSDIPLATRCDMNEIEYEKGYEDIAAASPYIDWEIDGDRALIHLVYVPPSQRGKGIGKQLFQSVLDAIKHEAVKTIRLMSAPLCGRSTTEYWKSLGFVSAYEGGQPDNIRVLHKAVNGFELPPIESVPDGEERHYIFD